MSATNNTVMMMIQASTTEVARMLTSHTWLGASNAPPIPPGYASPTKCCYSQMTAGESGQRN